MRHTWTSIEGHSCGRFKDEMDVRMGEAARNHKRYMFYFERFKNHADSIKKERANRAKLMARITRSEHDGVEARDFSWLVGALDQLRTARRVLCNSYAFAYFFFGGSMFAEDFTPQQNKINQDLFEDNQEMLAAEVERLSGLADKAAETLSLDSELRLNTINSSSNVHTRISNFFSLIESDLLAKVSSLGAQIAVPVA
ncbi:putative E3 ubiquitin-protein ligase ARI1 [Monoraphidium neglectum]|uniref:Putative E3 ubiquitin-protein ligase ARI1 n=1 Tax=Monoraphidium neglectum TaxID=145388 RepID=A0A0D2J2U4_9CHLO|nr:putative E3 ubiquitin-protein ligase ARI1 [Monoraphidium neglectum]KIY94297.1 putative E3 ubiquitin-protein ligase ARI1 [Monoraphidium neglectum]|eukprot:XP_013893317.1 putative E3 ubiquitin-protein ligase ARI1 [Monoraphidium neglectum]